MPETQSLKRKQTGAAALLFLTSLIWGFAFIAQLEAGKTMGSLTFIGVRFVIGALSLIPVMLFFEKGKSDKTERRNTLIAGLVAGTVLCAASNLQQYGIFLTQSAARSGFITGLYMVFVPILGIILKRKTTKFTWIGALIALGGLYALSTGEVGIESFKGDIALLAGAVLWAVHIMVIDHFAPRTRAVRFSMAQFWVCAIESLILASFMEEVSAAGIIAGTLPLLYTGLLSSGVAYTLQIVGQRRVEPARASVIFSTETVFSAAGEILILRKFLEPIGYLGCALILTGMLLAQIRPKKSSKLQK